MILDMIRANQGKFYLQGDEQNGVYYILLDNDIGPELRVIRVKDSTEVFRIHFRLSNMYQEYPFKISRNGGRGLFYMKGRMMIGQGGRIIGYWEDFADGARVFP